MKINKLYLGDNLEILKTFPDNSIDSVVTDPPYGLGKEPNAVEVLQSWITTGYHEIKGKGFMNKEWDAFVPQPIFWKEVFRVLKPGGYVLSFAGTRTYDWMVMAIRLAGFEIRDMVAWTYGSGFPKSMNLSKALDKHLGAERGKKAEKVRNPKTVGNGTDGTKGATRPFIEKALAENGGIHYIDDDTPISEEAQKYDGYGTALKPALEPIVMARKPLIGTVVENVLKHGTGAINIDGCRVPYGDETDNRIGTDFVSNGGDASNNQNDNQVPNNHYVKMYKDNGRFPANLIHDGSGEVLALFPHTKSGKMKPEHKRSTNGSPNGIYGKFDANHELSETYGDSGSAARFFYCAKASTKERNFGLDDFEETIVSDRPGIEKVGADNPRNRSSAPKKNIHPTVKPVALMRYLVRLVTPVGGICLDPYVGSGTTPVACIEEGVNYIGIDITEEYINLSKARTDATWDATYEDDDL